MDNLSPTVHAGRLNVLGATALSLKPATCSLQLRLGQLRLLAAECEGLEPMIMQVLRARGVRLRGLRFNGVAGEECPLAVQATQDHSTSRFIIPVI